MDVLELELTVSPEEMCRTCLAAVDRAQLKPIYCSEILDGKIVPFPKVIELATGEKLLKNEKFPNNICVACKATLREFYMFLEKVRKSSNLLYEIFSVPKPEPPKTVQTKVKTTSVAVQTVSTDEGKTTKIYQSAAPLIELVENGTQCDLPMIETCTEELCTPETHSEERKEAPNKVQTIYLNNFSATFEDVEKMSLIYVDKETTPSGAEMSTEMDEGTTNDIDEYDMILVTEEPSEEDSYALSTVKQGKKCRKKVERPGVPAEQPAEKTIATRSAGDAPKKKNHRCEYCNLSCNAATFDAHSEIHRHTLELCLDAIDYYRCPTCYRVFISQTHFDSHFKTTCEPVSTEKYVYNSDLKKHEQFYLDGQLDVCAPKLKTLKVEDNLYWCSRCPMRTKIFEEIRQHTQFHDADDDQMEDINLLSDNNGWDQVHVCGLCLAHFPDALYIRQHLYFHQRSFFCPYDCNMSFEKFVDLTIHLETTHLLETKHDDQGPVEANDEQEKFLCGLCESSFPCEATLEAHVKRYHRQRKHVCPECNKRFAQKSDLVTHIRIHTNERPYACEVCSKSFRTASHRRDHMTTHEVVNKYKCNVCHKLFKAERILAGHKRLHTGEKPFQCNVCFKVFARKHHVKLHSKVHLKAEQTK